MTTTNLIKSSRIIVKNLPKDITENDLKVKFNTTSEVTNIFLCYNKDNKFRRICFIGYKSIEDAEKAIKYWNNAYISNNKVTVEMAEDENDSKKRFKKNTEEEVNDYKRRICFSKKVFIKGISVDKDDIKKEIEEKMKDSIGGNEIRDVKIIGINKLNNTKNALITFTHGDKAVEFYEKVKIIGGRVISIEPGKNIVKLKEGTSSSIHFNPLFFNYDLIFKKLKESGDIDDVIGEGDSTKLSIKISAMETNLIKESKSFLMLHNLAYSKNDRFKESTNELIVRSVDIKKLFSKIKEIETLETFIASTNFLGIIKTSTTEEAKFIKRKISRNVDKEEKYFYCDFLKVINNDVQVKDDTSNKILENEDNIKTKKLLIKNLPFQASVDDVKNIFIDSFTVEKVIIPKKADNTSRGFCFVTFTSVEDVEKAIEIFGISTHLFGRRIVLEKAKS